MGDSFKISAIDIGSNSIKNRIYNYDAACESLYEIKELRRRVPLRLAKDIYDGSNKKIKKKTIKKLGKLLKDFEKTAKDNGVNYVRACATAAIRQAKNRGNIINELRKFCDLEIEVISGEDEIKLIKNLGIPNNTLIDKTNTEKNYVIVDVGGASTELIFIKGGKIFDLKSFPIGGVSLYQSKINKLKWQEMGNYLSNFENKNFNYMFGSGGGIRGLIKKQNRDNFKNEDFNDLIYSISYLDIKRTSDLLNITSDRAETIKYTGSIYLYIAQKLKIKKIYALPWGLIDGIAYSQIKKVLPNVYKYDTLCA